MNTVPSITASVASVSIVTTVALLLQGFVQDFFPGGGGGGGNTIDGNMACIARPD